MRHCRVCDPYQLPELTAAIKNALAVCRDRGPAVVIARHPCVIDLARMGERTRRVEVEIGDRCDGCGFCLQHFECPALVTVDDEERTEVDPLACSGCGVCLNVCPKDAIEKK